MSRSAPLWLLIVAIAALLGGGRSCLAADQDSSPPGDGLYAELLTDEGAILIELFAEQTPIAAINFVGLATGGLPPDWSSPQPFYTDMPFFRVVPGKLAVTGCPEGDGSGGPGYTIPDEIDPERRFDRPGRVAMANGAPDGGGSQFFITMTPLPHLDGRHTIFGQVVSGMAVVRRIGRGDRLRRVRIIRRGKAAKRFAGTGSALRRAISEHQKALRQAADRRRQRKAEFIRRYYPHAKRTDAGYWYEVLDPGHGSLARPGDLVTLHYTARIVGSERVLDSTRRRGRPVRFPLGGGRVIQGLELAAARMRPGAHWRLILPPELAFGQEGMGEEVPPGSYLAFDLKLVQVEPAAASP